MGSSFSNDSTKDMAEKLKTAWDTMQNKQECQISPDCKYKGQMEENRRHGFGKTECKEYTHEGSYNDD